MTTVELAVDTGLVAPRRRRAPQRTADIANEPVLVRIAYDEIELRLRVKQAGGRWLRDRKLWQMSNNDAKRLGLSGRVIRPAERS
jgi:hypothetical protein